MKTFQISYETELNEAQYQAVTLHDGPILVIAGAGTGKTRTLTYRVAHLVEAGINPENILLLTFTRKAAEEMLRRASKLLDHRCAQVTGGTFHSFANRVLRRYAPRIQFDHGFSIMDTTDAQSMINNIRNEWKLNSRERKFPTKATIAAIFSKSINKSKSILEILESEHAHFSHEATTLVKMQHAYQQKKREQFAMDYDDLLVYLRNLLKLNKDVCDFLSNQYQYIMVDEYQDTNLVQSEIIRLLASQHQNVMVVGDDAQSIYAFRGAHYKNILNFPRHFPGSTVIKLEENYRSLQPILSMTNELIAQSEEGFAKNLFTKKQKGNLPKIIVLPDEDTQSRFIVEMISKFSKKNKIKLQDMAVLFRNAFHANHLEIALRSMGIDYVKYGGLKILDKLHVKDFLALLRIMVYPYDELSWRRIFLMMDHVGAKTAQKITQHIINEQIGFQGLFTYKTRSKYSQQLDQLRNMLETADQYMHDLLSISQVVLNYYQPILEKTVDNAPQRMAELKNIAEMMKGYEGLDHYLTDMALEPPNTLDDESVYDNSDSTRLTLSTIHSAKGLEWRVVFIIWALDGRFPSVKALNTPESLDEELRLMYVATTRAKERLFITSPTNVYDRAAGDYLDQPSRFVKNLSSSLVKWHYLDD
ncbi:ATP-dependent DNA helicase pcrA [Candidatus Magnetomorum sp. HK-1]|nr:ATP-dependent DNA helicase pcrA [Candidatus Magnetomorum sp. HK-1]